MKPNNKLENRGGVIIILCIALLAIMKVFTTEVEETIRDADSKSVHSADWYNSKSIKQVVKENELDYLESLLSTGLVKAEKSNEIKVKIQTTRALVSKYEQEKTEILMGSANIPNAYWIQDMDGELGKIIGLNEWKEIADSSSKKASILNIGMLFLQISIVFGVIGLIIHDNLILQRTFTGLMIGTGILSLVICFYGYLF